MVQAQNKTAVAARAQQLIAGVAKHLGGGTKVTLRGGAYTAADLTTKLQLVAGLQSDVDAAKAAWKTKLAAMKTGMSTVAPLMGALTAYVKVTYGDQPDALADFGIVPKARAPMSSAAKTAAAEKRKATRAARGTKGPVQKMAIKGNVVGIAVTPITAQPVVPVASGPTAGGTPPAPAASPPPHAGS